MSKSRGAEPFSTGVCTRIRNLVNERKKFLSQRKGLFESRDNARSQLSVLPEAEASRRSTLLCEFGESQIAIDVLQKRIRWVDTEIQNTVENADQPDLFDDGVVVVPDFKGLPPESEDDAPVGGRHATPKIKRPEVQVPEGEAQQLLASVRELDIPEKLVAKLVAKGFNTMGQLIDAHDSSAGLAPAIDLSQNDTARVIGALKRWRTDHRKAAREVEGGGT